MNRVIASPVLSRLQHAWLAELGLDARMLGRYALADGMGSGDSSGSTVVSEPSAGQNAVTSTVAEDAALHKPAAPPAAGTVPAKKEPSPLASMRTALLAGKPLRKSAAPSHQPSAKPAADSQASSATVGGASMIDVSGAADMASLRDMISSCQSCLLHESRSHVVFGSGDMERPRLMILGESPGDHDDRAGEPFQGPTGKLLHAMLAAVGVDPAGSVFYTNIVKCRPLGSRPAQYVEIQSCDPYLTRQIELLQPEFVLALGRMAALALLGGDEALDTLRNRVHRFTGAQGRSIGLVATHHPTSLLLRARNKADVWSDLNLLRKAMAGAS